MKIKKTNFFLTILLILQNFFIFGLTYLNYNSMRGTDFNRYKKYLEYFITNDLSKIGLESGISYYWFISKVFDFYKTPLFISEIYVEPTITASIQIGNLIFFVF